MDGIASLIVTAFPVVRKILGLLSSFIWRIPRIYLTQVQFESTLGINTMSLPREKWDTWDPTLISEVKGNLFCSRTDLTLLCRACLLPPISSPPWSWSTSSLSTLTWGLSRSNTFQNIRTVQIRTDKVWPRQRQKKSFVLVRPVTMIASIPHHHHPPTHL